jgi:hypothetical protein
MYHTIEMAYTKVNHVWYPKEEEPEKDKEEEENLLDKVKDMF